MSTSLFSAPRQDSEPSRSVLVRDCRAELCCWLAFLVWLIYFRGGFRRTRMGILSTRRECRAEFYERSRPFGRLSAHFVAAKSQLTQRFMIAATCFSALVLISYITYHFFHGDSIFPGHGWVRTAYLAVLASHVLLSMVLCH